MIKEFIKKVAYPALMSKPDFLVIGAQKAGTTSLYRYLTQHPQILENKSWKEIRYFDLPENYSQGLSWYLGNFPSKLKKGNRLTFDASPSYLYFDYIPQRIQQDLGNIKMIAVLRDPAKRAYSAWQMYHSFSDNPHQHLRDIADERSFADAVDQELNDSGHTDYPFDYVNRGKYADQLKNYYKYFSRDNILVLSMDQLHKDLSSTLTSVCEFLGIQQFSPSQIEQLQEKKHNVGKYEKADADQVIIDQLKTYFLPFNEELYDLLGCRYSW
ncbi:MAG: sulfotransferase domain-containing protein [Microcoleaceae cyanobacterium]